MDSVERRTFKLAEALCMAVAKRYEPTVKVPWVSGDRDIQWAMDALRCHLTGDPVPPRSVGDLPRYFSELSARRWASLEHTKAPRPTS